MQTSMKVNPAPWQPRTMTPISNPTLMDGCVAYVGDVFPAWARIRQALLRRNLDVRECGNMDVLPDAVNLTQVDMILLGDAGNGQDPHEICGELRRVAYHGPILLLTSASDPISRVLGLENGADAWAAPDGDTHGIVAQIRALLRRRLSAPGETQPVPFGYTIRAGAFVLNSVAREAAIGQERLALSRLEFELLWQLVKHADQVLPRPKLAGLIGYVEGQPEGRALDTLVGRLRQRIGGPHAQHIRTIHSIGYMLRSSMNSDIFDNVVTTS